MNRGYLVQWIDDDGFSHARLMHSNEVIKYDCESDIYGINDMRVYDVMEHGKVKELKSPGWLPNCEIIWRDEDGNDVIHGFGEDH